MLVYVFDVGRRIDHILELIAIFASHSRDDVGAIAERFVPTRPDRVGGSRVGALGTDRHERGLGRTMHGPRSFDRNESAGAGEPLCERYDVGLKHRLPTSDDHVLTVTGKDPLGELLPRL